ncbi:hypothetical protein IPM19_01810 [bacterium]|nr:MAG: hypothetical protein IPM19_01810 [bacterium]
MYEKELQNLGLSEKEAKVYATSLELGADTAQNIAKQSGINRATTYVQINELIEKGLMSEFEKGKKTYYIAESPNRLKNLLGVIEKELELKKSQANAVIPNLLSMFDGMGERPKVRFFEGLEGARAMRDDFLKSKDKMIYSIIDYDKLFKYFPDQQENYTDHRAKKKVRTRVFYVSQKPVKDANSKQYLREAKHIPADKINIGASFTITDNKISVSTYSHKPIGIIIESEQIANTCRSMFEFFWAQY